MWDNPAIFPDFLEFRGTTHFQLSGVVIHDNFEKSMPIINSHSLKQRFLVKFSLFWLDCNHIEFTSFFISSALRALLSLRLRAFLAISSLRFKQPNSTYLSSGW